MSSGNKAVSLFPSPRRQSHSLFLSHIKALGLLFLDVPVLSQVTMATQAGMESQEPQLEQWIRPSDSRLVPLVLQTAEDPRLLPPTSRWTRIQRPRSRVHAVLRVSYWIGSSIFEPGKLTARYTLQSTFLAALKLGVAWPLLCILVMQCTPLYESSLTEVMTDRCG